MRFRDLEVCPFCGCEEYYERSRIKGYVCYSVRFDGEETDNTNMYDGTTTISNGKASCGNCERYLGNYINDTVGKAAERQCLKNSLQSESKEVQDFFKKALKDHDTYTKNVKKLSRQRYDLIGEDKK